MISPKCPISHLSLKCLEGGFLAMTKLKYKPTITSSISNYILSKVMVIIIVREGRFKSVSAENVTYCLYHRHSCWYIHTRPRALCTLWQSCVYIRQSTLACDITYTHTVCCSSGIKILLLRLGKAWNKNVIYNIHRNDESNKATQLRN